MSFFSLVRVVGLEPTHHWYRNLNPARLPIPPYPHIQLTKRILSHSPLFHKWLFRRLSGTTKREKSGHLHISKKRGILHSVEL